MLPIVVSSNLVGFCPVPICIPSVHQRHDSGSEGDDDACDGNAGDSHRFHNLVGFYAFFERKPDDCGREAEISVHLVGEKQQAVRFGEIDQRFQTSNATSGGQPVGLYRTSVVHLSLSV